MQIAYTPYDGISFVYRSCFKLLALKEYRTNRVGNENLEILQWIYFNCTIFSELYNCLYRPPLRIFQI